ncbi:5-formyltetrahydrofolate cyclo-ligase [Methylocella sp.]|uniref:5-formyltetrahydrofolate cyclo-ligase n=1 Tax=Methylocella sp. TaxID=1978226 RepID=UPI003782E8E8
MRAAALERRRAGADDPAAFAAHLAGEGLKLVARFTPNVVSAYFALPDEASTLPLMERLAAMGRATALPVTGKRGTPLVFRLWRPGDPLAPGRMGIFEPAPAAEPVDPDFLFVPLAAFDRSGNRLGYGAGFYDLTLARLRAKRPTLAVGVAYASQEADRIPAEPHDEKLDLVLTEKELIDCRGA